MRATVPDVFDARSRKFIEAADRLTFRSIRSRAALLTSALIAVALIVVIAYTHWALRRTLVESGEARAERVAAQLAAILGPPIPERLAELRRLVDDARVRRAVLEPSPETENAAFERVRPVASNAAVHQSLELWNAAGARVAIRKFPAQANTVPLFEGPPTATGALSYTAVGNSVFLDVVVPVRAENSATPAGYLVSRRVATNPNAPDILNRLVGDGGRVLVGNQSGSVWMDLTKPVPAPPIDQSRTGVHRYVGEDGEQKLAGVAHVANTPLAILVEFSEAFFVAPAWTLLRQLALVGAVFSLLALGLVWHISARVTRPLNDLTEALGTISGGDFSRRVDAREGTEVGRLGAAFNTMAAQIEAGLRELEARALELKENDRRRAAMMSAALDCIVTTDRAGRITECNPAAMDVFRHTNASMLATRIDTMLGLPRFADYHDLDDYIARAGVLRLGQRQEWTAVRSDGTAFPVEASVVAIRTGGVTEFATFIRDLTDQKAAEQSVLRGIVLEEENRRVQEASRLKSEFLANMSHELRTPLNAIIGFAELLYDGQVTPDMPEFKDFLHDILKSGQHLLQLINDVLDLSKVEAGKLDFHPEDASLEQVIGESVAMLRTVAAQKSLTVSEDVDPSVDRIFIDRGRLKQVLYNYLSNAIKFTPDRGRITVRVRQAGNRHFRIDVTDTGVGIDAADLSRLFVEFTQLEAGAAKKHQGTGLGLALTKRLVEAQGGRVDVVSSPGHGSTFSAILPMQATSGTPLADPRSIPSPRIGAPTVLVIEDDPVDQEAIVETLNGAGFNIETANSRAQAKVKLGRQPFDAITLDLILPDAVGADVLKDVRASAFNAAAPVVLITVVADGAAVTGCAVHDILSKPVEGAAVLAALERAGVRAPASDRFVAERQH